MQDEGLGKGAGRGPTHVGAILLWRAAFALAGLVALSAAVGAIASVDILNVDGPLNRISLGADLSCQAEHVAADPLNYPPEPQLFPTDSYPGDCGVFLMRDPAAAGIQYGPDFGGHTGSAADGQMPLLTPFSPVSQASGTNQATTVVAAGSTRIVQLDWYVPGDEFYTTETTIFNDDTVGHDYRMWRAVDCFLQYLDADGAPQGGDTGFGWLDQNIPNDNTACSEFDNNMPKGRFERLVALQPPEANYMESEYKAMWQWIATHNAFPDTMQPGDVDNAIGLSWDFHVPAMQSVTIVSKLEFNPGKHAPKGAIVFDASRTSCEDSRVLFTAVTSDADGDPVSAHWDFGDGAGADGATAAHTYDPGGQKTVTLTVTDPGGLTGTATATVQAPPNLNCCPVLSAISTIAAREGDILRFLPVAYDFEQDTLRFVVTPALPNGATLDPSSGYFLWPTRVGDSGVYALVMRVSDGLDHAGQADCAAIGSATWTITITARLPGTPVIDSDLDGIEDPADNCPGIPNQGQQDGDRDGIGDACEGGQTAAYDAPASPAGPATAADTDGDGDPDAIDNCPGIANGAQDDLDRDRIGDVCDADLDGDGVAQAAPLGSILDNCPLVPNADQKDEGRLGKGNACRAAADAAAPARVPDDAGDTYGNPTRVMPLWVFGAVVGIAALGLAIGTIVWAVRRRS